MSKRLKICIDPGHGGSDRANRGPTGYVEADGVLDISLRLRPLLLGAGFEVMMTRETDKTVALYDRTSMASVWGADLFISVHTNAATNPSAGGVETFRSLNGEWGGKFAVEAEKVAKAVQGALVQFTALPNRGVKTSLVTDKSSPIYGMDYYAVIRRASCPALIVEAGFHTNLREEALLKTGEFRQKIAQAIFRGISEVYGQGELTPIAGAAIATLAQANTWLRSKAPAWIEMAELYYTIAPKYKIRADVALAQSCKETGFYRFGGLVKPEQNNFCGLGATGPGNTGHSFPDKATGVEAHIQHLFAYATTEPLPFAKVDPRFDLVKRGVAPYAEYLGAAENPAGVGWASPGEDYGHSLVRDYLKQLLAVDAQENLDACAGAVEGLKAEIEGLKMEIENLKQQHGQLSTELAQKKGILDKVKKMLAGDD